MNRARFGCCLHNLRPQNQCPDILLNQFGDQITAEMAADTTPFEKDAFQVKPVPEFIFEISIETEELADSESWFQLTNQNLN